MNRISGLIISLIVMLGTLTSCQFDVIWDVGPVVVDIEVKDAAGHNLLDPEYENNIIGSNTYLISDGERYDAQWENEDRPMSRAYRAIFTGLSHCDLSRLGSYIKPTWGLRVGQLPGDKSYDRCFTLCIDGVEHLLRIKNKYSTAWDGSPKVKVQLYLDGKEYKNTSTLTIIHPK